MTKYKLYHRPYRAMALRGLGALLAASMTMSATGEVYRQVDPAGNVSYTDSAPGAGAERLDLPAAADEAAVDTTEPTDLVILYSAAWCNICDRARGWFDANGIDYIEYDVETDPQGREDYARLNGTGVPLIVVGGRVMRGFSPGRFQRFYELPNLDL